MAIRQHLSPLRQQGLCWRRGPRCRSTGGHLAVDVVFTRAQETGLDAEQIQVRVHPASRFGRAGGSAAVQEVVIELADDDIAVFRRLSESLGHKRAVAVM